MVKDANVNTKFTADSRPVQAGSPTRQAGCSRDGQGGA